MNDSKAIWQSKTLWLNLLAIVALVVQTKFGFFIDAETQLGILGVINIILRGITKQAIDWSLPAVPKEPLCLLLALALAGSLAACATIKKDSPEALATKSMLTIKESVVASAVAGDALCKAGKLRPKTCADLAEYYKIAGPAYDLAADALETAIKLQGDEKAWDKFQTALLQLNIIYGGITKLAGENGVLAGGAP